MSKLTIHDVAKELARLAIHYRDPNVNENTIQILAEDYYENIYYLSFEDFKKAIAETRRCCRFYPKTVDILEAYARIRSFEPTPLSLPSSQDEIDTQIETNKKNVKKLLDSLRSKLAAPGAANRSDNDQD